MPPDIAFQWRNVEIADDDRGFSKRFGPARHPLDEIELLAELRVQFTVGHVTTRRNIDILESDAVRQPRADVPGFTIVLPVVAIVVDQWDFGQDRNPVVHRLSAEHLVRIAKPVKHIDGENRVHRFRFLKAEDVGCLFDKEALNNANARTDRIDVPGCDFHARRSSGEGHGAQTG